MTGATGNIYCGLHEFHEMAFFLQCLRPGDLFLDVGANIGSFSVLAGKETGCDTYSFEPVPSTFVFLQRNMELNGLTGEGHVVVNAGVGESNATLRFSNNQDTTNHVLRAVEEGGIEVEVLRLDDVIPNKRTVWMKVDVEGFELGVLRGAAQQLKQIKGVVIELNGAGNRYGHSDDEVRQVLLDAGFIQVNYCPISRSLIAGNMPGDNAIYVQEEHIEFVRNRIEEAPQFTIRGLKF